MTSLLIDKLEALKSNEIKIKEERRILEEQIGLEMEKNKRLKMDSTLTKLEVQDDELENNMDSIMVNNNSALIKQVWYLKKQIISNKFNDKWKPHVHSNPANENIIEKKKEKDLLLVRQETAKIDHQISKCRDHFHEPLIITVKEFKNNINTFSKETIQLFSAVDRSGDWRKKIELKPEIKIYDDIIPLFRTLLGIMEKQQMEIDELKSSK